MKRNTLILAHHQDNANVAERIRDRLQSVDYQVELRSCAHSDDFAYNADLQNSKHPILLLVSDNYLKSLSCLHGALDLIQPLRQQNRVLPIITDGRYVDEATASYRVEPTSFERVSNVIHYMNYWQDRYLQLRREKRDAGDTVPKDLRDDLKEVRVISSEVGEFLRHLRALSYVYFTDLETQDYAPIFDFTNDPEARSRLAAASSVDTTPAVATEPMTGEEVPMAQQLPEPEAQPPLTSESEEASVADDALAEAVQQPLDQLEQNVAETFVESELDRHDPPDLQTVVDVEPDEPTEGLPTEIPVPERQTEMPETLEDMLSNVIHPEENTVEVSEEVDLDALFAEADAEIELESDDDVDEPDVIELDGSETDTMDNTTQPDSNDDEEDLIINQSIEDLLRENEARNGSDDELVTDAALTAASVEQIANAEEPADGDSSQSSTSTEAEVDVSQLAAMIGASASGYVAGTTEENEAVELDSTTTAAIVEGLDLDVADANAEITPPAEEEPRVREVLNDVALRNNLLSEEMGFEDDLERAQYYAERGEVDRALGYYQQGLAMDPNDEDLLFYYAQTLYQECNDLEGASEQIERVVELATDREEVLHLAARLAEAREDFLLAKNYYEKLLDLNDEYEDTRLRLAELIIHEFPEQSERALTYLQDQVAHRPDDAAAHYQLGVLLHEKLGQTDAAVTHFEQTLAHQPDHEVAWYDLALIHHQAGNHNDARHAYERAVVNNPKLKNAHNDQAFGIAAATLTTMTTADTSTQQAQFEQLQADIQRLERLILQRQSDQSAPAPDGTAKMDKTVLITGATSGIGLATAEVFAREGYRLILNGRREERLREIHTYFSEEYQTDSHLLPFDVRDPEAVRTALDGLPEAWRRVDILINNAGLASGLAPIHQGDLDDWERMIDTNVKGLLYVTRAISPAMVERGSGHIINVASTAGKEVYPKGNVYCATKHAVDALTKAMRVDLYQHGIRVSQVAPAHVEETEFARVRFHGDRERAAIYDDFQPLKATDVAEMIYFIASRPPHVNVQDLVAMGTQQASSTQIDRSGRTHYQDNQEH